MTVCIQCQHENATAASTCARCGATLHAVAGTAVGLRVPDSGPPPAYPSPGDLRTGGTVVGLRNVQDAPAGPSGAAFSAMRTTFGIHVLDEDSPPHDSTAPAETSPRAFGVGRALTLAGDPRAPDASASGPAPSVRHSTPAPDVGSATVLGLRAPALAEFGGHDAELDASPADATSIASRTFFGLGALTEDPSLEVAGSPGAAPLADDWIQDIAEFIEEKVADGTVSVPEGRPSLLPPEVGPMEGSAEPAGFGIVTRRARRRGTGGPASAPVETAGMADRRESSDRALRRERVDLAAHGAPTARAGTPVVLGVPPEEPPSARGPDRTESGSPGVFRGAVPASGPVNSAGGGDHDLSLEYLVDVPGIVDPRPRPALSPISVQRVQDPLAPLTARPAAPPRAAGALPGGGTWHDDPGAGAASDDAVHLRTVAMGAVWSAAPPTALPTEVPRDPTPARTLALIAGEVTQSTEPWRGDIGITPPAGAEAVGLTGAAAHDFLGAPAGAGVDPGVAVVDARPDDAARAAPTVHMFPARAPIRARSGGPRQAKGPRTAEAGPDAGPPRARSRGDWARIVAIGVLFVVLAAVIVLLTRAA